MSETKVVSRIVLDHNIADDWSILRVATEAVPLGWEKLFAESKEIFAQISELIAASEAKAGTLSVPPRRHLFAAYDNCISPRVVIFGQDPYPKPGEACGMAFSVGRGVAVPSSLRNIYKEIQNCYPDFIIPTHGDLTEWARRGVLLLNTALTTLPYEKNAHGGKFQPWLCFIDKTIKSLGDKVVYVMWGKEAQTLSKRIPAKAVQLSSAHPSGLSAHKGFFGNRHFLKINVELAKMGQPGINWQI